MQRNKGLATSIGAAIVLALVGLGATSYSEMLRRAQAEEDNAKIKRLADVKELQNLMQRAGELGSPVPESLARYEKWVRDANDLLARLPLHEQNIVELEAQLQERGIDLTAEDSLREVSFEENQLAWQWETETVLVDRLQHFAWDHVVRIVGLWATFPVPSAYVHFRSNDRSLFARIRGRYEFLLEVEERTLTGAEARARWEGAIMSIADPDRCPAYGGLEIEPQIGLLPIGRHEASGLWEFWHVQSGAEPARDEDGRLVITPATGIVLVLIPGGTFLMGATTDQNDPSFYWRKNQDGELVAGAAPWESPQHPVELDPYFISKYETTQGQWERASGRNPSRYKKRVISSIGEVFVAPANHPVESVTRADCRTAYFGMGLTLPTEAQWERAARGGTDTIWHVGNEDEGLPEANISDKKSVAAGMSSHTSRESDGYVFTAPVGTFEANPFGLHDVYGNVFEWCREEYAPYHDDDNTPGSAATRYAPGDGARLGGWPNRFTARGGAFNYPSGNCRSSGRLFLEADRKNHNLGTRSARQIDL